MRERGWGVMWGVGGDSAVQPHSMGGVGGGEEGHTQEHAQERTRECCTYPLATYPLKSARLEDNSILELLSGGLLLLQW